MPPEAVCTNHWCGRADRSFSVVFSVGRYSGALRRAIIAYKYQDQRWRAEPFARSLAAYLASHASWFEEFDLLVPVPAYQGRHARRTWDPVGLIFGRLVPMVHSEWDTASGAVRKTTETVAMSSCSGRDRSTGAAQGLAASLQVVDRSEVDGARVVVIDDVLTEGSTMREMAQVLRRAGALEVAGLVLARPAWRHPPASSP